MSGTNLGKLLAEAGVKGGKKDLPPLTLEVLRDMSCKEPEEVHSQEAMNHLPTEFLPLLETDKGEDFVDKLRDLLEGGWDRIPVAVTVHVVYGLVQLVHYHRDRLSGSKRKSFIRLVPKFLEMKNRLEKNPPADLRAFVLRSL
jgi:hypothetical protein